MATPTFLHRGHVVDAVESAADPDVICVKKSIAGRVNEAEEMVTACSEADVELVVNHARRFGAPYQAIETLVSEENLLREVQSVNISAPEELLRNGTHYIDLVNFLHNECFEWGFRYLTETSEQMGSEFDDSGGSGLLLTDLGTYVHIDCTVLRDVHDGTWTIVDMNGKLHVDLAREECRY